MAGREETWFGGVDFLVGGSGFSFGSEGEDVCQFGSESFRAVAADLFLEGLAFRVDELDVGDAGDAEGFSGFLVAVVAVFDVDVGPFELVVERLDFLARVNFVFHGLARRAPGGGEDEDDGFAAFFGISHDLAVAVFELGAAFGEVLGEGGEGEGNGCESEEEFFHRVEFGMRLNWNAYKERL